MHLHKLEATLYLVRPITGAVIRIVSSVTRVELYNGPAGPSPFTLTTEPPEGEEAVLAE